MYNVIRMKWGDAYESYDVNVLYHLAERNLSLADRFLRSTDNAIGLETDIEHCPLTEVRFPSERIGEA